MTTLIEKRYSPKKFLRTMPNADQVQSLFSAASLAPSSMNEQPWRFVYALQGDAAFVQFFGLLNPGNQEWAKDVPMLIVTLAKKRFAYNDNPNRFAWHDTGMATQNLLLRAVELGLAAHPMGGFNREEAVKVLNIPEAYEPVTMLAVGYLDENQEKIPDDRKRNKVQEFAFREKFSPQ